MTLTRFHWLAIAWTFLILVALTIPGQDLPNVTALSFDKVGHLIVFGVFGWLWIHALRIPLRKKTWVVLTAGIAFAVFSEIYQGLLPFDRVPDPFDALFDVLGLAIAVLLYRLWHARTRAKRPAS